MGLNVLGVQPAPNIQVQPEVNVKAPHNDSMHYVGEVAFNHLANLERQLVDMLQRLDNRSKQQEPVLTMIEHISSAITHQGELVKEHLSPELQSAWEQVHSEIAKISPEMSQVTGSGHISGGDLERVRSTLDTVERRLSTIIETERLQCQLLGMNRQRDVQFFFSLIERLHEVIMTALRAMGAR